MIPCIHFPLPRNYYFEMCGLYQIRYISDGFTLLDTKLNIDRYDSDHTPRFTFQIIFCNINLIELNIYKDGSL